MVLDTDRRSRRSWTVWEEDGKYPNVIFEILSSSTAKVDRTTKKALYQNTFRTPEYFWFDPDSLEFVGLVLVAGKYEPIPENENGYLWSQQLNLYVGVLDSKLRFFLEDGSCVETPEEAAKNAQRVAENAQQAVEDAQQDAEDARERSRRLAERLRALGVDPETV